MIEFRHMEKAFPQATPLRDVNAVIGEGDVIAVIGPSGTGKSTLLRCLNLLDPPTGGEIWVDGECITAPGCDVTALRRKIGMVFQSFNLFEHLTVLENVIVPQMQLLGRSRQDACDRAMELLRKVGLADKAFRYPDMLSGGQKQRIAIVRTLALDPEVILFDEPTSALDPIMTLEVQSVIRKLAQEGHTMMIVTHEMAFAREVSNRVFYMDEGIIYEDGTPERIFEYPQKEKTRRFVRRLKALEMTVESRSFDFPGVIARIEEFGRQSQMNQKSIRAAQTVFEELGVQTILPALTEPLKLALTLEYDEQSARTELSLRFGGKPFDPTQTLAELPKLLVQNAAAEELRYEAIGDGEFTNLVTAKLK